MGRLQHKQGEYNLIWFVWPKFAAYILILPKRVLYNIANPGNATTLLGLRYLQKRLGGRECLSIFLNCWQKQLGF